MAVVLFFSTYPLCPVSQFKIASLPGGGWHYFGAQASRRMVENGSKRERYFLGRDHSCSFGLWDAVFPALAFLSGWLAFCAISILIFRGLIVATLVPVVDSFPGPCGVRHVRAHSFFFVFGERLPRIRSSVSNRKLLFPFFSGYTNPQCTDLAQNLGRRWHTGPPSPFSL